MPTPEELTIDARTGGGMPAPKVFNAATRQWVHAAAIADPSGGTVTDAQARTATNSILSTLRNVGGVIAGATTLNIGQVWNGSRIVQGADIESPSGGVTVDANLRAAIDAILTVLRNRGHISNDSDARPALVLDEDTGAWSSAAIADVSGGTPADAECRTAINSALAAMRSRNLIAQD